MLRGFYREFKECQRFSGDEVDFGFLENIPILRDDGSPFFVSCGGSDFELTLIDFLHGYCHIFSRYLHDRFGYAIRNIYASSGRLIHSYCIDDDGNYVDVRGKTSDIKMFFSEFEDDLDLDCIDDYSSDGKISELENNFDRDLYCSAGCVVRDYYYFYCDGFSMDSGLNMTPSVA